MSSACRNSRYFAPPVASPIVDGRPLSNLMGGTWGEGVAAWRRAWHERRRMAAQCSRRAAFARRRSREIIRLHVMADLLSASSAGHRMPLTTRRNGIISSHGAYLADIGVTRGGLTFYAE